MLTMCLENILILNICAVRFTFTIDIFEKMYCNFYLFKVKPIQSYVYVISIFFFLLMLYLFTQYL